MKLVLIFGIFIASINYLISFENGEKMFIENESNYSFAETIEKLSDEIESAGWRITAIHDLQETMKKNGKEVLPVKVIETCNPSHAYKILSKDNERNASSMMPCRISVYEKSDGKTYISRMKADKLAGMVGGLIDEVMTDAFKETEEMIEKVIR
ncbi:MAG: DUF302 domain-containing protein [Candidatus Kapabacteria bacterium]|jgi:uncharacterized protein (DUF302 family)|nr:DUF302 domain-containing protein [Candidatus Kapabacteria bacterium]